MICIHLNDVLLITPNERLVSHGSRDDQPAWLRIEPGNIGNTLRQVRHHRPKVLVFDLTTQCTDEPIFLLMLDMINAIHGRVPGIKIAVLGAHEQPAMEILVRQQGVTVYIPLSDSQRPNDARDIIQALYSRHGPNRAHSPP